MSYKPGRRSQRTASSENRILAFERPAREVLVRVRTPSSFPFPPVEQTRPFPLIRLVWARHRHSTSDGNRKLTELSK